MSDLNEELQRNPLLCAIMNAQYEYMDHWMKNEVNDWSGYL